MQLGRTMNAYMAYGFGYHSCANEYKIVSIYYDDMLNFGKGEVSVYTLGSGKWRNKGEILYWLFNVSYPGAFANEDIHWFDHKNKIVSFDLVDEEFRVVAPKIQPAPSHNYVEMEMEVFLSTEIILEVLTRLPADSAIGCRGICKQWRSLIDHPSFRDSHTRQVISSSSYNQKEFGIPNSSSGFFLGAKQRIHARLELMVIEYNDAAAVGDVKSGLEFKPSKPIINPPFPFRPWKWGDLMISSCNGLVFMGSRLPNYINDMFVCNPFTREYVNLRGQQGLEHLKHDSDECDGIRMAYGFGYHPSTNEYKVVRIFYATPENMGNVSIYTLGSRKWRSKGNIPYWLHRTVYPGMLANGAIHWYTDTSGIVSFDLAEEEFRVVVPLLPPPLSVTCMDQYGVLAGCLSVTAECESFGDIWVLNVSTTNNKQEEWSWNKKFSIPWKGITCAKARSSWNKKSSIPWKGINLAKPQVVTKSGKILLSGGRSGCSLVSYDPETEAFVYGDIFPNCSWGKLISYTQSFVSLKALGEEDVKCWRSVAHAQALAQQP